jgi:hypothetical protein
MKDELLKKIIKELSCPDKFYYPFSQLILLVIIFIWFQNISQEGTRIGEHFDLGKLLLQKLMSPSHKSTLSCLWQE